MQHQERPADRGRAFPRRTKMTRQNVGFVDALIRKEAIGCLCIRPILTCERDAFRRRFRELLQYDAEALT